MQYKALRPMLTVQQEVNDVTLFQTPLLLCEDSLP